jgi:hypothetical protein
MRVPSPKTFVPSFMVMLRAGFDLQPRAVFLHDHVAALQGDAVAGRLFAAGEGGTTLHPATGAVNCPAE